MVPFFGLACIYKEGSKKKRRKEEDKKAGAEEKRSEKKGCVVALLTHSGSIAQILQKRTTYRIAHTPRSF